MCICYVKLATQFLICIALTERVHGYTNCLNTLQLMEGNFLKSVLTWLLCIKINEIYARYSDAH